MKLQTKAWNDYQRLCMEVSCSDNAVSLEELLMMKELGRKERDGIEESAGFGEGFVRARHYHCHCCQIRVVGDPLFLLLFLLLF